MGHGGRPGEGLWYIRNCHLPPEGKRHVTRYWSGAKSERRSNVATWCSTGAVLLLSIRVRDSYDIRDGVRLDNLIM